MATDAAPPIPLPDDPSIEQLRKQARELQAEMRRDDPSVKLSSAQRLVAAEVRLPELAEARAPPRGRRPLQLAPGRRGAATPTHPPTTSCASPA